MLKTSLGAGRTRGILRAMRVLLQRVAEASVTVDAELIAKIGPGLLTLVGVFPNDGPSQADWLADKTLGLRIFPDGHKPMNRSVLDVGGAILVVSQFTLAGDLRKGKRPSFSNAAPPLLAQRLYQHYAGALAKKCPDVQTGRFGANMQVALINDGPATFLLER